MKCKHNASTGKSCVRALLLKTEMIRTVAADLLIQADNAVDVDITSFNVYGDDVERESSEREQRPKIRRKGKRKSVTEAVIGHI